MASKDKTCEECGRAGYIHSSNISMTYGNPDYGNPNYQGEPCPSCNLNTGTASDGTVTGTYAIGGIAFFIALIAIIRSMRTTAKGIILPPFTSGWTITAWVYGGIVIFVGIALLIKHIAKK